MKKYWILAFLISALLILTGCGGGGGGGGGGGDSENGEGEYGSIDKMVSMNIGDAKSLFINTSAVSSASSQKTSGKSSGNNSGTGLYKITGSGEIKEVDFLDKNRNKINMGSIEYNGIGYYPVLITNVNDGYLIIGFSTMPISDYNPSPWIEYACLVRKNDGAVYKLNDVPSIYVHPNCVRNENTIKLDSYNNIYYLSGQLNKSRIVRVNVDLMSSEYISPSTDSVEAFEVDGWGNILYLGYNNAINNIYRLRTRSGNLRNMVVNTDKHFFWKGPDEKLYYFASSADPSEINMVNPTTGDLELYGSFEHWFTVGFQDGSCRRFSVSKSGINYTYLIDPAGKIDEVYNSSDNTPKNVSISGLIINSVTYTNVTDNYLYIAGKDNSLNNFLVRVTPGGTSLAYDSILGDEYEIYSFTASEDDGIIFNALRMADGRKIVGKISTTGGPVIVLDEDSDKIAYLERIR